MKRMIIQLVIPLVIQLVTWWTTAKPVKPKDESSVESD